MTQQGCTKITVDDAVFRNNNSKKHKVQFFCRCAAHELERQVMRKVMTKTSRRREKKTWETVATNDVFALTTNYFSKKGN
jgi:hypothetical protein